MANNTEKDNHNFVKQEIIEKQVTISELLRYMTAFSCTTCAWSKLPERSPEYLIMLDRMKHQLYNIIGVMRDFFADWPIQCDCMIQLQFPLSETFRMVEYLFDWYPNAYNIDSQEEGDAIKLYEAIYKDAYKFHVLFNHVLNECLQSHTFLKEYNYSQEKCVTCRFREHENNSDSESIVVFQGQELEP